MPKMRSTSLDSVVKKKVPSVSIPSVQISDASAELARFDSISFMIFDKTLIRPDAHGSVFRRGAR